MSYLTPEKRLNAAKSRNIGLVQAREQFLKDIQSDKDFIEFRKKSEGYGAPVAATSRFTINHNESSNEQLIKSFIR